MIRLLATVVMCLLISGCDHIPSKTYELETVNGTTVYLRCPTVDPTRSTFTYAIDSGCVMVIKETLQ